jgi:hypothetical protein
MRLGPPKRGQPDSSGMHQCACRPVGLHNIIVKYASVQADGIDFFDGETGDF